MRVHCWTLVHEAMGYEWLLDALMETGEDYDALGLLCMLEYEHEGPHCFVPMDAIGISFEEASA